MASTGRLFSDHRALGKVRLGRWFAHWRAAGALAIALWLSWAALAGLPAYADAMTPEADAYQSGPIRQTHDPLSGENFHGGVDPAVLGRSENPRRPEDEGKGLLQRMKERVFGKNTTPGIADLKTQKNPTLERYPDSLK